MHILGIANGTPGGNSEILLKAALTAATATDSNLTASWIHAPSVTIPPNPKTLEGSIDISQGALETMQGGQSEEHIIPDDRSAVLNAILDADALILSTPVYSHAPQGMLKGLTDRIMGPYTDAAFAQRAVDKRNAGDGEKASGLTIEDRILKPRVVGFLAVAGSTTLDQVTLALPTLHLLVYCMHAKVVDQEVLLGFGPPGSVIFKDDGQAITRAQKLGQNVASQMGKHFDDAQYLGPEPEGACPYCKLAKVDLFCGKGNRIGCITCGAEGYLSVEADGTIRPIWEDNSAISSITMAGKQKHVDDLIRNGIQEGNSNESDPVNARKLKEWRDTEIPLVKLPSHRLGSH